MVFFAFDLLVLRGPALIEDRKQRQQSLLSSRGEQLVVLYIQALPGQAEWLYQQCVALELEGVVCKRGLDISIWRSLPCLDQGQAPGVHQHGASNADRK